MCQIFTEKRTDRNRIYKQSVRLAGENSSISNISRQKSGVIFCGDLDFGPECDWMRGGGKTCSFQVGDESWGVSGPEYLQS